MRSGSYRGWFVGVVAGARMERIRGSPLAKVVAQVVRELGGNLYPDMSRLLDSSAVDVNLSDLPGYCYLAMIKPRYHISAMVDIGPNPTFLSLTQTHYYEWWDTAAWSSLFVEKTGDSQVHVALSGRYALMDVLRCVSPQFLSNIGIDHVVVGEMPSGITKYTSVGFTACYADVLAQAYRAFPMSLQYCVQQAVRGHTGAILASVYADVDFGHVRTELFVEDNYYGSTVLCVPPTSTDVAYLLPPGWYYSGAGFKIGSAVKPTVLLVPRAYGIRICTDAPYTQWTVDSYNFQLAYADACANPWWDALWSRGFYTAHVKSRTMSNVLIHIEAWQDNISPVSRLEWLSMNGYDKRRLEDRILYASDTISNTGRVDAFAILRSLEKRVEAQTASVPVGIQCVRGRNKLPVVEMSSVKRDRSLEVVRDQEFLSVVSDRAKDPAKDYLDDSLSSIDTRFTSVDNNLRAGAIASNYSDISSQFSRESSQAELDELSFTSSIADDRGVSAILLPTVCAATVCGGTDLSWLEFVDRAYDTIDHAVLDGYDVVGIGDDNGFSVVPVVSNGNARKSLVSALEQLSYDRGGISDLLRS